VHEDEVHRLSRDVVDATFRLEDAIKTSADVESQLASSPIANSSSTRHPSVQFSPTPSVAPASATSDSPLSVLLERSKADHARYTAELAEVESILAQTKAAGAEHLSNHYEIADKVARFVALAQAQTAGHILSAEEAQGWLVPLLGS
jgi:hypothetical protein